MKIYHHLNILLIVILCTITSCKKEEEAPSINEYMTATIDGKTYRASTFVVAKAGVTTSINGTVGPVSNPESIGLSVKNVIIGTFTLDEDSESFAVYNSSTDEYISSTGTLQIISLSPGRIEGSFDFIARSINDPSQIIRVSNGKFIVKLNER
jgi:hypothetical protein